MNNMNMISWDNLCERFIAKAGLSKDKQSDESRRKHWRDNLPNDKNRLHYQLLQ